MGMFIPEEAMESCKISINLDVPRHVQRLVWIVMVIVIAVVVLVRHGATFAMSI
ncbi:hypothetical protein GCM10010404_80860 [Nonomuraea africana]|uniref:Uncharacterized protein n=1 Tax=Nonomuraea africana TaxID=46171 RepID=A0ABR9KWX2_9ACTN|nr:hypothetical protein [Nonomuraea africana]MBE1566536.1 hypothetical protein [Nonomuraea africana]